MKGDFTRWTFKPENHYHAVLKQQGRVDLDADWNEQDAITGHRVETETIDVVGPSGAPVGNAGFVLTPSGSGVNLSISAGRAYVDGILCENEKAVLMTAQLDLPGFTLPTAAGNYIAFLEVWLRHLTALDDPAIQEVALGPDTCTRAKTIWQVRLLPVNQTGIDCSTVVPEWTGLIAARTGTLAARAQPDATNADPCLIPANAGYRRLENQLYRVEIHDATASKTTFKWSRDNGSVAAGWLAPQSGQPANTLRVSSAGPDGVLGFAAGQWVEVTDDVHDLNFQQGTLVQLTGVSGTILTYDPDPSHAIPPGPITFPTSPDPATYPDIHPRVRRWDSVRAIPIQSGTWIDLEDGVQVNLSNGTFAQGDYWLIPARTLTADVEWPKDSSANPVPQTPKGIRRHFCKVAVVQLTGTTWSVTAPCLPTFPPLTAITAGTDKGIHVLEVRTAIPDAPLLNDSIVQLNLAPPGKEFILGVICDAVVDSVSAKPTTCFLTLEIPYPFSVGTLTPGLISGYQPLVLPATVRVATGSTGGSEILLIVTGPPLDYLQKLLTSMAQLDLGTSVLVRLTLKGNLIWGRDDPTTFLDGDSFGIARAEADGTTHIDLRLPKSGDGRRGGDFQMWFWLTLPVASLSITTASPLPNGAVNVPYSKTLAATGGTHGYTWALVAGTLPAGLSLNTSTGEISGTPTAPVTSPQLTFRVTDSGTPAQTASKQFALTIAGTNSASITVAGGDNQTAQVNTMFAQPLKAAVRDASGSPISGETVTFTVVPFSGAGGTFVGGVNTAVTDSTGVATSALFVANATTGTYTITAKTTSIVSPATFHLTNTSTQVRIPPVTVGQNLETVNHLTLSSPAASNLNITLTSNDASKVLLSATPEAAGTSSIQVTIVAGSTGLDFCVHALANSGFVTYTVSGPGFTGTGTVSLAQSAFVINAPFGIGQDFLTTASAANTDLGILSARLDSGGKVVEVQAVRGGLTVNVSVTSSNPAVGTITTSPVVFSGGVYQRPTQFDPASAGSSTLAITTPTGFGTAVTGSSVLATVNTQQLWQTTNCLNPVEAVNFLNDQPGPVAAFATDLPTGAINVYYRAQPFPVGVWQTTNCLNPVEAVNFLNAHPQLACFATDLPSGAINLYYLSAG